MLPRQLTNISIKKGGTIGNICHI